MDRVFFNPQHKCAVVLQSLFQNQDPLFTFKQQVRINKNGKMRNEHSVDYHPSLSGLPSRIHSPIFL